MVWAERYFYNTYLVDSTGIEKYYLYKYSLFLLMNIVFYQYISILGMNGLIGVLVLDILVSLTFIYDSIDYILEITFYTLFLIGILSGYSFVFFFVVALLASLNRESSIFLIPISFFYCDILSVCATVVGFLIGFIIPRIIYRKPVDPEDACHKSGFRFLTFNPIRNWRGSIWPYLKKRFIKVEEDFWIQWNGRTLIGDIRTEIKEIFLNRIFLGVGFILFCIVLFASRYSAVDPFFHMLTWIFSVFIICISLPADIREIRVYAPVFVILVPYLMS